MEHKKQWQHLFWRAHKNTSGLKERNEVTKKGKDKRNFKSQICRIPSILAYSFGLNLILQIKGPAAKLSLKKKGKKKEKEVCGECEGRKVPGMLASPSISHCWWVQKDKRLHSCRLMLSSPGTDAAPSAQIWSLQRDPKAKLPRPGPAEPMGLLPEHRWWCSGSAWAQSGDTRAARLLLLLESSPQPAAPQNQLFISVREQNHHLPSLYT